MMSLVEIRDHALWIKHVHGNSVLTKKLTSLEAGDVIELRVDGFRGTWVKMSDGKDGRSTPGIKPVGKARDAWHRLQDRRGDLAPIDFA